MNAVVLPKKKRTFLGWIAVISVFLVFVLGVLSAAFFVFMYRVDKHVEAKIYGEQIVDVPLPSFELPVLNDPARRIGNNELRGTPYLISTWASWCRGCAYEHPALERLAKSKRIQIIGLNMQDDAATATRWLERYGNPYSMILFDEDGAVADRFDVLITPDHILIDAKGVMRWRLRGPISDEVIRQELLPVLDRLNAAISSPAISQAAAAPGADLRTHVSPQ